MITYNTVIITISESNYIDFDGFNGIPPPPTKKRVATNSKKKLLGNQ